MGDASLISRGSSSSSSRRDSGSRELSETSKKLFRRKSEPALKSSRPGADVDHQPPSSPRSTRRLPLDFPSRTTPSPPSSPGQPESPGSNSPKSQGGSAPKYKHVPAKLVNHLPADELEKICRYLDWAQKEHEDNLNRLTCLVNFGDALQRLAVGGMEGWDAVTRGIRETLHGKPKGPNAVGVQDQSRVYYVWGLCSSIKVATFLALLFKKHPALSTVALASTYSIPFPAGIHSLTQFRDWLRNYTVSCKDYKKALSNMEGALRFITRLKTGKASVADARAYRAFTSACSKIPAVSPSAALDRRKTTAAAIRDCLVLLGTVTTSMLAQAAVIRNENVKERGKLMIGAGACYLAQGVLDLTQGWFAERPRCAASASLARKSLLNASAEGAIPLDEKVLHAANQTYLANLERHITDQDFETTGGTVRGAKGVCNLVVGAVSLANGISQTAYEKDTGPTSTLIGTAAAFVSMAYMTFTATKMRRRANTANEKKYCQRQAQMLIARYSHQDLRRAIENNQTFNLQIPKGKFDEQSGDFPTNKVAVSARDNPFLGLHLVATELSEVIDKGDATDKAEVIRCLRDVWGMAELNLQSMFLIAQATAPKRRLAFLKSCLAPVFFTEFRFQDESRLLERPLKASVVAQLALDLAERKEWSSGWREVWYPVLKEHVLDTVGRDEFIIAVQKIYAERIKGTVDAPGLARIAFLRHAADAARSARWEDYQSIVFMTPKDTGKIIATCGVTKTQVSAFVALVNDYAAAKIYRIERASWGDPTAVAAFHKRQAESESKRLRALGELEKDPVAQALLVDSARIVGLKCQGGLGDLLSRLDRRVSDANGDDSDCESTVGAASSEDDSDTEFSLFERPSPSKGRQKKTQATSGDNIDGDEESEIVVSDDGDPMVTEPIESTQFEEKPVKRKRKPGDDLIDAADDVKIQIEKPRTWERRREIVRTMTERAKNQERKVIARGGAGKKFRNAGENNPDNNDVV